MQGENTHNRPLLETLDSLLAQSRPAFGQQRVFERACDLVWGTLFSFSRKTMMQILGSLGRTDQDWTAAYRLLSRNRFQEELQANILLRETLCHVPAGQPYQAVLDATPIPRSSRKMPGTGWGRAPGTAPWKRGLSRQQRFENISWLTPVQEGYSRAIPLRFLPAPTAKSVPSADPACREWEAGFRGMQWLRQQLDANGRADQTLFFGADGSYDTNGIWKALPHDTVLVCRCAKNRKLSTLPAPALPHTRGARRKYGERVNTPQQMRQEKTSWDVVELPVRRKQMVIKCRVCGPYLVDGCAKQPLMLLLVKGYHYKGARKKVYHEPCQYLVNAVQQTDGSWGLPLPLADLLAMTWHRWEIEVCHRQIKTGFGLGQMQCWSQRGSTASVQFMAWAYSLLMLAGYRAWSGLFTPGKPGLQTSPGGSPCWQTGRRRWTFATLLQSFRHQLWDLGDFRPVYPGIESKGQKNRDLNVALANAALSASRG